MDILPMEIMIFYHLCGIFPVMKFYWQKKIDKCLKIINWWSKTLPISFTVYFVIKLYFDIRKTFLLPEHNFLLDYYAFYYLSNFIVYVYHVFKCHKQSQKIRFIFCVLVTLKDALKASIQKEKYLVYICICIFGFLARLLSSEAYKSLSMHSFYNIMPAILLDFFTAAIYLQFYHLCQKFVLNFVALNDQIIQEVNFQSCELLITDFQGLLKQSKLMAIKGKQLF